MTSTNKKIEALEELLSGKNITPTLVYNEGWMLRLVLNWLSENRDIKDEYLFFQKDAKWFSEASLPTKFKAEKRGDKLYESHSHADGVYGNIESYDGKGFIKLEDKCKQLVVIEAKMFSKYSNGITNAKTYNQVARIVACMCELICDQDIEEIAFYTFLPDCQKEKKVFSEFTKKENIKKEIEIRIEQYKKEARLSEYEKKREWYSDSVCLLLDKMKIELITWEYILDLIKNKDKDTYDKLNQFYNNCITYNKK